MLFIAVGVAVAAGRPTTVLSAIGCMAMMVVMMAAMGGHREGSEHGKETKR